MIYKVKAAATQPLSRNVVTCFKPHSDIAFMTSGSLGSMIPEQSNIDPLFINEQISCDIRIITSATILAQITSYFPSTFSVRSPQIRSSLSETRFRSAFSCATLTASSSISTPTADFAPSSKAVIARIPLPHPTSNIRVSEVT